MSASSGVDQAIWLAVEQQLGHTFSNRSLAQQALTHRSFSAGHYERLEFLGDSVLNCAASSLLYALDPELDEGRLSRVRSHLVRQDSLASLARQLNIEPLIRAGSGERKGGLPLKDSILADALEALLGALFLEAGFAAAEQAVHRLLIPVLDATPIESLGKDPKTRLQELLQGHKLPLPTYVVIQEGGTAQQPEFVVECAVQSTSVKTLGKGASRRLAEQQAADQAILELMQAYFTKP